MSTQQAPRRRQSSYAMRRVAVRAVRDLTPHMRRITLGGPELAQVTSMGLDQRIKVLLPLDGQSEPEIPVDGIDWYQDYLAMPEEVRPWMRTYTLRTHRDEQQEIDVDFVLHGDAGPASAWAAAATPGQRIVIVAPDVSAPVVGYEYQPPDGTEWTLLAGDETALPAIGGILEGMREGQRAVVFVEIADDAERQDLTSAAEVALNWLPRNGVEPGHGTLLAEAIAGASLPEGRPYAWVAAESAVAQQIRRHLVGERGIAKEHVYFSGYWRLGAAVG